MKSMFSRCAILATVSISLSGCLYNLSGNTDEPRTTTASGTEQVSIQVSNRVLSSGESLGGNLEQYMDENDKFKLSRGLDSALGKATTWKNPINGTTFTVTPLRKTAVTGGKFCRTYTVTMEKKTSSDSVSGTACIGDDGSWHVV